MPIYLIKITLDIKFSYKIYLIFYIYIAIFIILFKKSGEL